jgi:hypothetical protein
LKWPQILSEFYHLRRTAIKDLASYVGFLIGFIGAAPFAWGLLGERLSSGEFVRGLWYFFGIVIAAGIFTGIAGLGIGHVLGIVWEQIHRHLRAKKLIAKERAESAANVNSDPVLPGPPKLTLIPPDENATGNAGDMAKGGHAGQRRDKR